MIKKFLEKLDLTRQEIKIYLAVLNSGSASIRKIAAETNINRGMVYESLKKLAQKGLITRSKTKKQEHFIAEDPEAIKTFLKNKIEKLADMENEISASLPRLKAFYRRVNQEPYIKIYEGAAGAKFILEDLLKTMKKKRNKEYFAYSSSNVQKHLCKNFSDFNDRRTAAGIKAKIIILGKNEQKKSEQSVSNGVKWLGEANSAPACVIIYDNKIAMFSLNKEDNLTSVLIEDPSLSAIHKAAFEKLWKSL
ncbi:MAG: helix-turn-helix domain-containing protein [Patescibacteria group bacterium]